MRTRKVAKDYVVLTRKSASFKLGDGEVYNSQGFISCDTCGGSTTLNREKLATEIGVSTSSLSKFLNRQGVRPDIADKIRSSVLRVVE